MNLSSEKPAVERDRLLSWLRRAGFLVCGLVCAGWLFPDVRLWGAHHLAFLPSPLAIILLAGAVTLFSPIGTRAVAWAGGALKQLAAVKPWVWVVVAAVVFVVMRESEPLLGDGQALLRHLETMGRLEARYQSFVDKGTPRWTEPLETALHENVYRVITVMHPPVSGEFNPEQDEDEIQAEKTWFFEAARWTYILLSAAAGAVLVLLVIRFARKVISAPSRPVFLLTTFTASGMLLYFGYVEDYAWTAAAVCACLLFAIEESGDEQLWPKKTLVAFAVAVAFHLVSLLLLPAIIFLLAAKRAMEEGLAKKIVQARWLVGTIAFVGVLAYLVLQVLPRLPHLLPILPSMSRDGYAFLSLNHVADVINLLLLCGALPVSVVLLFRKNQDISASERFLQIAAVCGLAFVVFFDPNLAMPRDWDLYSVAFWPLIVLAAWKLVQVAQTVRREELLAIVAGFALLIPLPFLLENISVKSETARVAIVLKLDPSRSAYGWENLAAYYRRIGDSENTIRALRQASAVDINPHYKLNLANELRRAGRLEEAEPLYIEAARARPEYVNYLLLLAQDYARRGEKSKVLPLARIMVEIAPGNPVFTKLVADLERTASR